MDLSRVVKEEIVDPPAEGDTMERAPESQPPTSTSDGALTPSAIESIAAAAVAFAQLIEANNSQPVHKKPKIVSPQRSFADRLRPDAQFFGPSMLPQIPLFFGPAMGGPLTSSPFLNGLARTGVPLTQAEADLIVKCVCENVLRKRAYSYPECTLWNQSIVRQIREQLAGRPFTFVVTCLIAPKGASMSLYTESQAQPLFSRWENGGILVIVYITAVA